MNSVKTHLTNHTPLNPYQLISSVCQLSVFFWEATVDIKQIKIRQNNKDCSTYMYPVRICGLSFPLHIQWYRPCWLSDIFSLQRPSDLCNLCCPLLRLRCTLYWAFQGQISHVTQERKHISVEAGKLICFALAITLEPEPANWHTDVKYAGLLLFFAINI